jgi:hypothetical protein
MPDRKISDLSANTTTNTTDETVLAVSGTSKKITLANLINGIIKYLNTTAKGLTGVNDSSDNEIIKFTGVASAVNEVTITNATTGNKPTIEATGNDTNIDLWLKGKGSGVVKVGSGANEVLSGANAATQAEVNAGTTGSTKYLNASTPSSYTIGVGASTVAKTYFNMQLPFLLWTGDTLSSATTSFTNWTRNSPSSVITTANGAMVSFINSGTSAYISTTSWWWKNSITPDAIKFSDTDTVVMDWFAILPTSPTGDITMGISMSFIQLYNDTSQDKIAFTFNHSDNKLYATTTKSGTGTTNTDVSAGITNTNWNNFRIETTLGSGGNAKFYINGTLVATLSGANFPTSGNAADLGFGRQNTALFRVTAPNLAIKMI